jgi:hypothetical protein
MMILLVVGVFLSVAVIAIAAIAAIAAITRHAKRGQGYQPSQELSVDAGTFRVGSRTFAVDVHRGKSSFTTVSTELELAGAHGEQSPYRASGRERVAALPRVLLRAERETDRVGKRLSLNREARTGDADFDAKVYIESDASDGEIGRLLESAELRSAVLEALAVPCRHVAFNHDGHGLTAYMSGVALSFKVSTVARALERIAAELPPITRLAATGWNVGQRTIFVSVLVAALSWLAHSTAPELWQPLGPQLRRAALLLLVLVLPLGSLCIWFVVRRRSNGFRAFVFSELLLLVTAFTAPYALLTTINGVFDEPEERAVNVIRKWTSKPSRRSSTQWWITVEPWGPPQHPVSIRLSASEWDRVPDTGTARIRLGSGFLGFEWYASLADP